MFLFINMKTNQINENECSDCQDITRFIQGWLENDVTDICDRLNL